jgi:hypothetical protein
MQEGDVRREEALLQSGVPHASKPEKLQVVRKRFPSIRKAGGFLRQVLRGELEVGSTGNSREVQEQSRRSISRKSKSKRKHLGQSSGTETAQRENAKANQGRKAGPVEIMEGNRFWYDSKGRVRNVLPVSKSKTQLPNPDWVVIQAGEPTAVLAGFRVAGHKVGRGGGRPVSQPTGAKKKGRSENQIPFGTRVVGVEVLKSVGAPRAGKGKGSYQVYNLEVEGHPSYSVNGVLIHNSYQGIKGGSLNARLGHFGDEVQSMFPSFLDAYSNWYGKQNFKGIMAGNPNDLEDCLCIAAEPVDGWANWKDTQKTQTWRSRFYDAAVVSFDGRDSPNMDVPETEKAPFPYLIGRKKLKAVEKTHGKDSWQYASQCTGKPRPGAMANRVITRQLCEEHNAFEDVIWSGKPLVRIAACDAAYGGIGGDDCIMGHIEFGEDVDGRTILACNPPVLVPVSVTKKGLPEEQIANFVKDYCLSFDIPPENFFFDARSTMAITFARIWSPSVNVVDFGGAATPRPVSMDTFVWDGDTQTRRLQMCNELYSKFVTELWYSIYYIIVGNQMARLPREVADEGCKREWKLVRGNRIEIETKKDMKLRTGRSPDRFDWLVTAVEGARRRGFEMMSMASVATDEGNDFWLEHALEKHNKWAKRHELKYA